MTKDRIVSLCEWGAIVATCLADYLLSAHTGIALSFPRNTYLAVLIIMALWPTTFALTRWRNFAQGSEVIPESAAKFFLFIFAVSALEYYLAAMGGPLWDDKLIRVDALLGFDWPRFFAYVQQHNWLMPFLKFFYFSLMYQALAVLFAVGIIYPARATRITTAFIFSAFVTMFFFWLVPVAGPFVAFGHTDLPQADYTLHYIKMREHIFQAIPVEDLKGIVSFPSFHVSSAVIIAYFFRRIPIAFPVSIFLNIGMGVSALVIGGHYLSDLLAGVAVGAATILFLHILDRDEPETCLAFTGKQQRSSEDCQVS